jgi:hypothetical protein
MHSRINARQAAPEAYRSRFNALDPLSPNSFLLRAQTIMSGAPKIIATGRPNPTNDRQMRLVSPATGSDGRGRRGFATGAIRRAPPTSATQAGYHAPHEIALRQNPRDATLSLNGFSVSVMLVVGSAAPVVRCRATCVLESAPHRARPRDVHAAVTGLVIGRRLACHYPCRRARGNDTSHNANHYEHGTTFARRERVGRWGLACIDRRRLLCPANAIDPQ